MDNAVTRARVDVVHSSAGNICTCCLCGVSKQGMLCTCSCNKPAAFACRAACHSAYMSASAASAAAWQRSAADFFIARLAMCTVRVVWSSWMNAVLETSLLAAPQLCPWWYGEERFNRHKSRYEPPEDTRLAALLALNSTAT